MKIKTAPARALPALAIGTQALGSLALGAAGLFVVVGALALFAWTRAGYAGLGVLASACVILAAAIVWAAWRTIQHGPPPFATTAEEFRRDLEWLRPE